MTQRKPMSGARRKYGRIICADSDIFGFDGVRRTNRWTGAAVARFASSLVQRDLNKFAPPGQLRRSTLNVINYGIVLGMKFSAYCTVLVVILGVGNASLGAVSRLQSAPTQRTEILSGLILDPGQARVPGAKILVEGKGFQRMLTSADDGSYTIELPDGKYHVSATRDGFYPSRKKTVRVRSGTPVTVNITLKGVRNDASHP